MTDIVINCRTWMAGCLCTDFWWCWKRAKWPCIGLWKRKIKPKKRVNCYENTGVIGAPIVQRLLKRAKELSTPWKGHINLTHKRAAVEQLGAWWWLLDGCSTIARQVLVGISGVPLECSHWPCNIGHSWQTGRTLHLLKSMASGHLKIKKGLVLYLYWPLGITLLRVQLSCNHLTFLF